VSERTWGFESPRPHVSDFSGYLETALEVAAVGSKVAMGHYRKDPSSKRKADGTWVTEADWAAEAQIRLVLARAWPDHNILGEEEGLTAAGGGPPHNGAPTWVLDPIDGTNNFMAGIPIWATLVALMIDGESIVGVADAPALGEVYDAALGLGARCNGSAIAAAEETSELSAATVLHAGIDGWSALGHKEGFDRLMSSAWRTRGLGDFWGHMLVARGAAHVMVEPRLSRWDVAALQPIVTEAGGRLTNLAGEPWGDGDPCVTTNGPLHDEVLKLLGG
jgi:histidinol-phosphatase